MNRPNQLIGTSSQDDMVDAGALDKVSNAANAHPTNTGAQDSLLAKTKRHSLPEQIFVTGTDTGVGKTLISAILTIGLKAHYWKPIQSGTVDGTDREWIQSVSKLTHDHFLPEVYSLRAPLSPHAAAQLDEVEIELEQVNLPQVAPLIVEGAGGIMVPINKNQYMLDLIQRLKLPTIIVARSGLGTINHTLLTLDKLRTQGVEILGVVMNGTPNPSNREALEHFGQVNILAEIPQLDSVSYESLEALFELNFERRVSQKRYQTGGSRAAPMSQHSHLSLNQPLDQHSIKTSFARDAAIHTSSEVVNVL